MQDIHTLKSIREHEQRERQLAELAEHPSVAAMHRELAEHYREMIVAATPPASR